MRAVDTNLLVRIVARDDPTQTRMAQQVMAAGPILVLPTVLLEAEWVLRSRYYIPRQAIANGLITLLGQPNITVFASASVGSALAVYTRGGDFADLLHSALADELGAEAIVTFDQSFASVGDLAVEVLGQPTT